MKLSCVIHLGSFYCLIFAMLLSTVFGRAIQPLNARSSLTTADENSYQLGLRNLSDNTQAGNTLLIKRDDDAKEQEAFGKALCKGNKLMKAMKATDAEAGKMFEPKTESAQSKFTDFNDLEKWGYGTMAYDDYYEFDVSLPIKPALKGMGVSDKKIDEEGGKNMAFIWEHEVETEHSGKKYPITGASYTTICNPEEGVILGWGAFSPAYMGAKKDPPVTVVPDLKSWSDITFLQWADLHKNEKGPAVSHLRYIMKTPCENPTTQLVIKKALKNTGQTLSKWPGVTFSMDTKEGVAILGTPNGWGVAYLLVQHKKQLGNKVVDKVTVFQDEGPKVPRPPSVLFYIKGA